MRSGLVLPVGVQGRQLTGGRDGLPRPNLSNCSPMSCCILFVLQKKIPCARTFAYIDTHPSTTPYCCIMLILWVHKNTISQKLLDISEFGALRGRCHKRPIDWHQIEVKTHREDWGRHCTRSSREIDFGIARRNSIGLSCNSFETCSQLLGVTLMFTGDGCWKK